MEGRIPMWTSGGIAALQGVVRHGCDVSAVAVPAHDVPTPGISGTR